MSQLEDTKSYLKLTTALRPSFQYCNTFTEIDYMEYFTGHVNKTIKNVLIHGIGMLVLPVSVTVEITVNL